MHVDAGEAKEKMWIEVLGVYSLGEYVIGCKKNSLGWHCTGWVLPSKGRMDLQLKKEGEKMAQDSAQSPLSFPHSSPWPLCPL